MKHLLASIRQWLKRFFKLEKPVISITWQAPWSEFLLSRVSFYRELSEPQRRIFEQRALLFLDSTDIVYGEEEAKWEDKLLLAASAIIPVWSFPKWHYFNLQCIYLMPAAFNGQFECGQPDSHYLGMVGEGPMAGKMAISLPALRYGFSNDRDKQNVAIHEFAHLIDMADGDTDGFPDALVNYSFALPWFELLAKKVVEIDKGHSNIDPYASSNKVEFFAVATEYFFERPKMLKRKHPELYRYLESFYQQDRADIASDIAVRKNSSCSCGSGKVYKRCCMPDE